VGHSYPLRKAKILNADSPTRAFGATAGLVIGVIYLLFLWAGLVDGFVTMADGPR